MTSKNQLTLPRQATAALGNPTHFEIAVDADRLVLTPARLADSGVVRRKLETLGIVESDVADAIAWARKNP